jgi:hypothetical protein
MHPDQDGAGGYLVQVVSGVPTRQDDPVRSDTFFGRHVVPHDSNASNNGKTEVLTIERVPNGVRSTHFMAPVRFQPRRVPAFEVSVEDLPRLANALLEAHVRLSR